ncbi:hypothetical protein [Streptomyces sp. NPDC002588]|uniref:anti-sigma factor family protein n=1 Tax=Streptomyces sp. NPDC002588 TaxID=3154419 RepID=UPI003328C6BF
MTSTTDTTGHPDVAEISDLTEGLLTPARSDDVRRHLEDCALCADVHASLEEIRGLLGDVPGPSRMPDDIAQRIDAALAAEVPHVSRETPSAADRPAGRARAGTGPGRKRGGPRRRIAVLGTLLGVAALGLGGVLVSSLTHDDDSSTTAHGQPSTADTFAKGTLEQRVTHLLDKAQGSKQPDSLGVDGGAASPETKIFQLPTVPACVQKGIGRDDAALATAEGTYQRTPALLVVLPDSSDSTKVDAYLMDRTCVQHPSVGAAKILLRASYPRR